MSKNPSDGSELLNQPKSSHLDYIVGSEDCTYGQISKVVFRSSVKSVVQKDWSSLAIYLDIPLDQIQKLRERYNRGDITIKEVFLNILTEWVMLTGKPKNTKATLGNLLEAMLACEWIAIRDELEAEFMDVETEDSESDSEQSQGSEPLMVFSNVNCDICDEYPLTDIRYKCLECDNFDICSACYQDGHHAHHIFAIATNLQQSANLDDQFQQSFSVTLLGAVIQAVLFAPEMDKTCNWCSNTKMYICLNCDNTAGFCGGCFQLQEDHFEDHYFVVAETNQKLTRVLKSTGISGAANAIYNLRLKFL